MTDKVNAVRVSSQEVAPQRCFIVLTPYGLLWLLMLIYAVFFSAYSIQRHATFNTYAADLSYFDQPMWNTLHGHFLERTLGNRQVPRMTDHMEPILVPMSLVYLLWNDVRAILILQTLALAVGALPVYWIARRVLSVKGVSAAPRSRGHQTEWLALAFVVAYLMFPALQAANLADFHADPFIVTPLLFAFWYATQRRYWPMWVWAAVAMLVKENLPTLTFMLGLYLLFDKDESSREREEFKDSKGSSRRWAWLTRRRWHGLALMAVSLAWLYVAMFVIVGPVARQFYGTEGPVYLSNRYPELGGGLLGMLRVLLSMLGEPARLGYLSGLLTSVGWLAVLAPEYLLLGLPVLVANTFSNFPGQYSGEQHYSAPLVPIFIIAAIYGARRLRLLVDRWWPPRASRRYSGAQLMGLVVGVWLLAWSLGYQIQRGWTPLARDFDWPQVTAHQRLLARFAAQIPPDAAVSTTPPLHPHLDHRRVIYLFPIVADADYVLVDVSGVTDMHPNDVRTDVERLLASGQFRVVDAADGYILLAKGQGPAKIPDAFYDFARAPQAQPEHELDITFGNKIKLIGYDLLDDPKWRLTHFRFYWRTSVSLSQDMAIAIQTLTPAGKIADDTALRPMPALLWYPPSRWRVGETVVTESVPWYLPRVWAPVIGVSAGGQPLVPQVSPGPDSDPGLISADGRLRLAAWARQGGHLVPFGGPQSTSRVEARFANEDWAVRLTGYAVPPAVAPGHDLPVMLHWQAGGFDPAPRAYTVFLHLRDQTGKTVANGDAVPTWFTPWPTSQWQGNNGTPVETWDAHTLTLPADLTPGHYDLVVGWYYWETGQRLSLVDTGGNALGDEFVLGEVVIDPAAAPPPDMCCLFASECCASQE